MAAGLTPRGANLHRAGKRTVIRRIAAVAGLFLLTVSTTASASWNAPARAARDDVRFEAATPATIDPAAQGDVGSAAVSAQLFESLTAVDPSLTVRPALAAAWDVQDEGRRIVFHLRPGITFSDGSPISGADVVRSWLRIIDHKAPSPLASLMLDVKGAADYLAGRSGAEAVGLHADGGDVQVDLLRPAADFVSVVAGASFGIVPDSIDAEADPTDLPAKFVGSGGYVVAGVPGDEMTLTANDRYWAGRPAIGTIHLVGDTGDRTPLPAFQAGNLDYVTVPDIEAPWMRYDAELGPQLRKVASLSVEYYGFDTTLPPFDDVLVRRAFAGAIDWRRIAALSGAGEVTPATSMVPPGIPGRDAKDYVPAYDPSAARAALAQAGYPGGSGFPVVTLVDQGSPYAAAIVTDLRRELGIDLKVELYAGDYFGLLKAHPPQMWSMEWVADYPGANDFLGILLGTGQSNNFGRWTSGEFDAATTDAGETTDATAAQAAYARAQAIVQRDAPVVPIAYRSGWALSRTGLLGAGQNGLGMVRMAGLAWGDR